MIEKLDIGRVEGKDRTYRTERWNKEEIKKRKIMKRKDTGEKK